MSEEKQVGRVSPIDALARAIEAAMWAATSKTGRQSRPGWLVSRLPEDVREGLRRLTSDEARSMRHVGL